MAAFPRATTGGAVFKNDKPDVLVRYVPSKQANASIGAFTQRVNTEISNFPAALDEAAVRQRMMSALAKLGSIESREISFHHLFS